MRLPVQLAATDGANEVLETFQPASAGGGGGGGWCSMKDTGSITPKLHDRRLADSPLCIVDELRAW